MVGFEIGKLCPVQHVSHYPDDMTCIRLRLSGLLFYFIKYSVGSGYSDFLLCNPKPEPIIWFLLKQQPYPTRICTRIHLWAFGSGGYGRAGRITRVAG